MGNRNIQPCGLSADKLWDKTKGAPELMKELKAYFESRKAKSAAAWAAKGEENAADTDRKEEKLQTSIEWASLSKETKAEKLKVTLFALCVADMTCGCRPATEPGTCSSSRATSPS